MTTAVGAQHGHAVPVGLNHRRHVAIPRLEATLFSFAQAFHSRGAREFTFHGTSRVHRCATAVSAGKLCFVLQLSHKTLRGNTTIMKNSAKYMFVNLFAGTDAQDFSYYFSLGAELCDLPRRALGFVSEPKGQARGDLTVTWTPRSDPDFLDPNNAMNLGLTLRTPFRITDELLCRLLNITAFDTDLELSSATLESILVVEKGGVFDWLVENKFYDTKKTLLVCSHGSPTPSVIAFVQMVQQHLNIPAYGISDMNPSGIRLLNEFYHSKSRIGAEKHLRVELANLGVRPTQVANIPHALSSSQLTDTDKSFVRYLLHPNSKFLEYGNRRERFWELVTLVENGIKIDLECWEEGPLVAFIHMLFQEKDDQAI